ncbi:MAG: metallophosphoesterase [Rhodothermales bacterium]|nr:metallophosphoesterase [Rhodothermales bacterium]
MGFIAIGDIHGCARTLDALLERLAPANGDHLVFIGDYIDRGPDSKGVIDRLLALHERQACTFLRGNHEALLLGYLDEGEFDLWRMNGGLATLQSYAEDRQRPQIPEEHLAFVRATELYLDTPEFLFVHAGLRPDLTVEDNLKRCGEEVFLWERSHLDAPTLAWEKPVVCGHTPRPEPLNREQLIDIDTGCVYHMHPQMGHLTAVRLPEREFISVPYEG